MGQREPGHRKQHRHLRRREKQAAADMALRLTGIDPMVPAYKNYTSLWSGAWQLLEPVMPPGKHSGVELTAQGFEATVELRLGGRTCLPLIKLKTLETRRLRNFMPTMRDPRLEMRLVEGGNVDVTITYYGTYVWPKGKR